MRCAVPGQRRVRRRYMSASTDRRATCCSASEASCASTDGTAGCTRSSDCRRSTSIGADGSDMPGRSERKAADCTGQDIISSSIVESMMAELSVSLDHRAALHHALGDPTTHRRCAAAPGPLAHTAGGADRSAHEPAALPPQSSRAGRRDRADVVARRCPSAATSACGPSDGRCSPTRPPAGARAPGGGRCRLRARPRPHRCVAAATTISRSSPILSSRSAAGRTSPSATSTSCNCTGRSPTRWTTAPKSSSGRPSCSRSGSAVSPARSRPPDQRAPDDR